LRAKNVASLSIEFPALQPIEPKQLTFLLLFLWRITNHCADGFSGTFFCFRRFRIRSGIFSTDPLRSKKRGQQCRPQP
jgi:hypothetical protein